LAALKGDKTLAELAQQFDVHHGFRDQRTPESILERAERTEPVPQIRTGG